MVCPQGSVGGLVLRDAELRLRVLDFPAFWARSSGSRVDRRFDSVDGIAAMIDTQIRFGLGGILVANPIPEADALDAIEMEAWIDAAIRGAEQEGIGRSGLTPFLLQRIFELTGGRSLTANIALVRPWMIMS